MKPLPRQFYQRPTQLVAESLLGHCLVHRHQGIEHIGRIVEVEAYLGTHDLACHAAKGITPRTSIMFGPAGFAYVYLIYGMYYCFNIVTDAEGIGAAVLIRALEPIANLKERTEGPGLLSRAMHIDKRYNGQDLLSDTLFVTDMDYVPPTQIVACPRIGVAYAKEWAKEPLRFYIENNAFVSQRCKKQCSK